MWIEIEKAECFADEILMVEHVVGPQATLAFFRDLVDEYLAEIGEFLVQAGIAADHGDHAWKAFQAAQRRAEMIRRHVPEIFLVDQQAGAVGTAQVAAVCDVDTNDVHVCGGSHGRDCPAGHTQFATDGMEHPIRGVCLAHRAGESPRRRCPAMGLAGRTTSRPPAGLLATCSQARFERAAFIRNSAKNQLRGRHCP